MQSLQQHPIIFPPTKTAQSITAENIVDIVKRENLSELQQIKLYSTMIEICPQNIHLLQRRCDLCMKLKQYEQVLRDVEQIIKIKPTAEAYYDKARTYWFLKQKQNAVTTTAIALEVAQKNLPADNLILALIFDLKGIFSHTIDKDYTGALQNYDQSVKLNPLNMRILFNRAAAYYALQNRTAALQDCSKTIETNSNNIEALNLRSKIYKEMNQIDKAIQDVTKITTLKPKNPDAYLDLADLFLKQNNPLSAISHIETAIRCAENEPSKFHLFQFSAIDLRAQCYYEAKQMENAIQEFDKAIKEVDKLMLSMHTKTQETQSAWNIEFNKCLLRRALTFKALQKYEEALADLHKYLDLLNNQDNNTEENNKKKSERRQTAKQFIIEIHEARAQALKNSVNPEDNRRSLMDFKALIELDPTNSMHYLERYNVHQRLREFELAKIDWDQFCKLEQDKFTKLQQKEAESKETKNNEEVKSIESNLIEPNLIEPKSQSDKPINNKRKLREEETDTKKRQETEKRQEIKADSNKKQQIEID